MNLLKTLILLAGMGLALPALADGAIHLLFHIGQVQDGQLYVGGTVRNDSTITVKEGFVVIVPLDKACYPGKPLLQAFGAMESGEKTVFHVPLTHGAEGYRLVGVGAVDDMGYPLPVVDDTFSVIQRREKTERQTCRSARQSS